MTDLEKIKAKIDIVDYLSEYMTLKKAGRNFKALCPFHSEKTPSFVVSSDRQTWHCFGACQMGGDIFEFVQKWENIEFFEALKILAKRAGVELSNYQPTEGVKLKDRLYEINHLASEYYHFILKSHPLGKKAYEYVRNRGISDKMIDAFSLGYSPNSWDAVIKFLRKKNYTQDEIVSSGLAIKTDLGRIYDRFRGRLMFTLKDHRGNYVGFSGRKIDASDDKEAKYINTPETPVYIKGNLLYGFDLTLDPIRKVKEAIIVEGEFDFLSAYRVGTTNIAAIKGSAFTEGQIQLLKRHAETIILALDSDFAGSEAAKKGIEHAEKAGLLLKVIQLPIGKDPDECIQKDPGAWKKAVKNAVNIYDFLIEKFSVQYDETTISGKKKIGDEIAPFLSRIDNPIIYSHYVKLLSKRLDVDEEAVNSLVEKSKRTQVLGEKTQIATPSNKKEREEIIEEYFLSLILQSPHLKQTIEEISKRLVQSDFILPPVATIISKLTGYFNAHESLDVKLFTSTLSSEVLPTFDLAYLTDQERTVKDHAVYDKEVIKTSALILSNSLRRKIGECTTKIRKSEKTGDEKEISVLQIEVRNLLAKLQKLEKETK